MAGRHKEGIAGGGMGITTGDKITVIGQIGKSRSKRFDCTVLAMNARFITVDMGNYRESINFFDIRSGRIKIYLKGSAGMSEMDLIPTKVTIIDGASGEVVNEVDLKEPNNENKNVIEKMSENKADVSEPKSEGVKWYKDRLKLTGAILTEEIKTSSIEEIAEKYGLKPFKIRGMLAIMEHGLPPRKKKEPIPTPIPGPVKVLETNERVTPLEMANIKLDTLRNLIRESIKEERAEARGKAALTQPEAEGNIFDEPYAEERAKKELERINNLPVVKYEPPSLLKPYKFTGASGLDYEIFGEAVKITCGSDNIVLPKTGIRNIIAELTELMEMGEGVRGNEFRNEL